MHEQDRAITEEAASHGNDMNVDIELIQDEQQTAIQDRATANAQHQPHPGDGQRTPAAEKVIHSTEDLYNSDGEPDEFWCRVEEEEPDE